MEHQPGGLSLPLLKRDEQDIRAETIVSPFGNSETIIGICEKIMIRPHHRKWGHLAAALVLITTQVVFVSLSGVENGKVQNTPWGAALWVRGICFAMQVVTAVYFFIVSLREVHTFVLSDIWVHYFATGLNFGGVYMFMYTCDPASLAASPGIFDSKTDAFDIGMGMVYFSFSTQALSLWTCPAVPVNNSSPDRSHAYALFLCVYTLIMLYATLPVIGVRAGKHRDSICDLHSTGSGLHVSTLFVIGILAILGAAIHWLHWQTLVGYGDIISSKWYAVVLCRRV